MGGKASRNKAAALEAENPPQRPAIPSLAADLLSESDDGDEGTLMSEDDYMETDMDNDRHLFALGGDKGTDTEAPRPSAGGRRRSSQQGGGHPMVPWLSWGAWCCWCCCCLNHPSGSRGGGLRVDGELVRLIFGGLICAWDMAMDIAVLEVSIGVIYRMGSPGMGHMGVSCMGYSFG